MPKPRQSLPVPVSAFPNDNPTHEVEAQFWRWDHPLQTLAQPPRVLLIEPLAGLRETIQGVLQQTGCEVIVAATGAHGLQLFDQYAPIELVLVETAMCGLDGYQVCTELRKYSHVPLLLLSEPVHVDEMIYGLSIGADAYIIKPFNISILEARLRSVLRRTTIMHSPSKPQVIAIDEIVLNSELHEVSVRNQLVSLSPIEYGLLYYLMHMADRPVSKQELFHNVWGYHDSADVNVVRVGVHRLREKIEEAPNRPSHVLTVPGFGYKFRSYPKVAQLE